MGKVAAAISRIPAVVGPLFTKELLVTSRRARYYVLRFGYAAVLGLFIALVWLGFIESATSATVSYRIAHMSEMGKQIVSSIVCFQFAAAQLVAVILLSGAISEEIYQRTLVPILTTPIGYWQIVLGKFLGKLLHVGFLLAVSLPLMGMVRVLGGVPWNYLLAGVCITVTASMFAGSVALFFSVLCRRVYLSILAALGVVAALYGFAGLILLMVSAALGMIGFVGPAAYNIVLYPNPVAAMIYETVALNNPASAVPGFLWPIHCLLVLAATLGVLKLSESLVGRLALRKAIGTQAVSLEAAVPVAVGVTTAPILMPVDATVHERAMLGQAVLAAPVEPAPRKRRIFKRRGWNLQNIILSPIIWRELRKPLLRDKVVQIVATCAVLFYLLYTYAILGASGAMDEPPVQSFFVTMFLLAGMVCVAMDASTCIAPEMQARTWPALLCTPVSDWHILLGKAGGTIFRCLPVWLFLLGHVVIFTVLGFLHPLLLVHILLLGISMMVFLAGCGVYFSTRCRRTSPAVLLNIGFAALIWGLIPGLASLLGDVFGDHEIGDGLMCLNPIVQSAVIAGGATYAKPQVSVLRYEWPGNGASAAVSTAIVLASALLYGAAGTLMAWRAKKLFRRNVFDK